MNQTKPTKAILATTKKSKAFTEMSKTAASGKNLALFDQSPLTVGSFRLTAYEAVAVGSPSAQDWQEAYIFATNSQESSPYWVADLLDYAHRQGKWKAVLDQMLSTTGLSLQTLYHRHSLGSRVKPTARKVAQSYTHASKVVKLEEAEQIEWLDKSATEGWNSRELEQHIRSSKRLHIVGGRAPGMFTVDVTVAIDVTGDNTVQAEDAAWKRIKQALASVADAKVIAAHCRTEVTKKRA
jgi:hypothetical protein